MINCYEKCNTTPDPDCNLYPAEIRFKQRPKDRFSFFNRLVKFSNPNIRKTWRDAWTAKEEALRVRFTKAKERMDEHARVLPPLKVGDRCLMQNQTGNNPKKWDRSGTITEVLPHDQYTVKVDGSSRVTRRNRRFLRSYVPATMTISAGIPAMVPRSKVVSSAEPPTEEVVPWSKVVSYAEPPTDEVVPRSKVVGSAEPPTEEVSRDGESTQVITDESITTTTVVDTPRDSNPVSRPRKPPLALRRLLDHNKPGLKEKPLLQ